MHGERVIYDSPWVRLGLTDVEVPGIRRFEHHVVRLPQPAAGVIAHDERGVLLLWRHRFITDTWGWEIPAGVAEPGEAIEDTARREALEETGWTVGPLTRLATYHPMNGLCDQTFHLFVAEGAERVGDPSDPSESSRVGWVPIPDLRAAIERGEVNEGLTLTAVTYALAFGRIG